MMLEAKELSKNKLIIILCIGFLLRALLASSTYFGDITYIYAPTMIWTEQGHFDIYSYIINHNAFLPGWIYYPPCLLYIIAGFAKFFAAIFPGFVPWIHLLINGDVASAMSDPMRFIYLFSMKIPYLAAEALMVFFLLRMVPNRSKRWVVSLWILNPVVIYLIYVMGQFDILVGLAICLAVYSDRKGFKAATALFLGTATALKVFPALVLFGWALITGKKFKEKMVLMIIGVAVPALLTLPFLVGGNMSVLQSYITYPDIASTEHSHFAKFAVHFLPTIVVLFLIMAKRRNLPDSLPSLLVAPLFIFILTIRFDDRYLFWAAAPLVLIAIQDRRAAFLIVFMFVFSGLTLITYYGDFTTHVFSPIAGKPILASGIAEYCIKMGFVQPHKIFKLLTKIFMVLLVIQLFIRTGKRSEKQVRA